MSLYNAIYFDWLFALKCSFVFVCRADKFVVIGKGPVMLILILSILVESSHFYYNGSVSGSLLLTNPFGCYQPHNMI